jgi:mono/diheme cytochrome c family protein
MQRLLIILPLALIGLVVAGLAYFYLALPAAGPPPDLHIEATPARLKRGAYLANHVLVCIDCHSQRDWDYYSGPVVAGSEGMGGERFGPEMDLPGTLYARNITPAGIGDWSDGELARLITSGVTRDGQAIFPLMPYPAYNRLAPDDLHAIIAYIRSLAPIENQVANSQLDFPLNLIVRTVPQPYPGRAAPDRLDQIAYGGYLTAIAGCAECHTPAEQGEALPGMYLAGGFEFIMPDGQKVRSANITSDLKTGIGGWSETTFVERFKTYATAAARRIRVDPGRGNTVMPWTMYAGMEREDLEAIYAYLRTVKAVKNKVELRPDL